MELRLPLEMSPGREAACRAVFGTWGFFPNDARKNCPFVLTFIHRLEFGEVSGHRVLIKRGPGNRGPTECGSTHEATSGMSSSLGSRSTSLKEYAAAHEGGVEGYAGDGGDFLVGYDMSDHLFPDLSSIPILVFLLDFHDFRKNI